MSEPSKPSFSRNQFAYNARAGQSHHFLRPDHLARLSRNNSVKLDANVLRPETIAIANVYSEFNEERITDILTDKKFKLSQRQDIKNLAKNLARTGVLVIPYYDHTIKRIRTDKVEPKYMSPYDSEMPPYLLPMEEESRFHDYMKTVVVAEAAAKLNKTPAEIQEKADFLLNLSKFDSMVARKDPTVPMLVVEGEFKALAIYDAMLDAHRDFVVTGLSSGKWNTNDLMKLRKPPVVYTVGIGGVWNMIYKDAETEKRRLLPEWEKVFPRQKVIICFDSDLKKKVGVAQACAETAKVLTERGVDVHYLNLDTEKRMGADDYIQAYGYEAFVGLLPQTRRITGGQTHSQLLAAQNAGVSLLDVITNVPISKEKATSSGMEI